MDPVSSAIIAAAAAGLGAGVKDTATKAVTDLYSGLKALITRKAPSGSDIAVAMDKLERNPASAGWKEEVATTIAAAGLDRAPDILAAAEALRRTLPQVQQAQTITGNLNAVANNHSTATVTITLPDRR